MFTFTRKMFIFWMKKHIQSFFPGSAHCNYWDRYDEAFVKKYFEKRVTLIKAAIVGVL